MVADKILFLAALGGVLLYSKSIGFQTLADQDAKQIAADFVKMREGTRKNPSGNFIVYKDSEGFLTAGWGHKLVGSEANQFPLGSVVPNSVVEKWYVYDIDNAYSAANSQMAQLPKKSKQLLIALTSVNFQLGTGWRKKFPNTWARLLSGDWQAAISGLQSSLWAKQTPVRVSDFVGAIKSTYA